jgi:cytochrome c oxidase subunit 2
VRTGDPGTQGTLGPDLTHLMSRSTIAAGTLANNTGNLHGWIANPQALKPGTQMPATELTAGDLHDVVAYLQTLR